MKRREVPNIAVLVDTSTGWGRRLIRGVLSYAKKHGPWHVYLEPRGQTEVLRLPIGWSGQGVIARIGTRAMSSHLSRAGRNVVNVSSIELGDSSFPRVTTDNEALARTAVEQFTDRGISICGYVGLPNRRYSMVRQQAFADAAREVGLDCHSFRPPTKKNSSKTSWRQERNALRRWLTSLPKPIGLLTWGVRQGIDVIDACDDAGINVPDEVAVLSGEDDELLCQSVRPSLSSIVGPAEQIGHHAAAILDSLLAGRRVSKKPCYLEPVGVVSRTSTDVLAISDPDVGAALRFIKEHADQGIRVIDVAQAVAVSRRSLERRFKNELGHTVGYEIARAHLRHAKMLLSETDMPIAQVAIASGYGSPEYFVATFRRSVGQSPLKYRTQIRGR